MSSNALPPPPYSPRKGLTDRPTLVSVYDPHPVQKPARRPAKEYPVVPPIEKPPQPQQEPEIYTIPQPEVVADDESCRPSSSDESSSEEEAVVDPSEIPKKGKLCTGSL